MNIVSFMFSNVLCTRDRVSPLVAVSGHRLLGRCKSSKRYVHMHLSMLVTLMSAMKCNPLPLDNDITKHATVEKENKKLILQ